MSGVIAGAAERPLPVPNEWDRGFWDAAKKQELVVQCCGRCKKVRSFPRLMCPSCRSLEFEWLRASGKGRLYSWNTLYQSFHPAFVEFPLTVGIIELEDYPDVHLVGGLQMDGLTEDDLHIDQPVEVVFHKISKDVMLPEFRVVKGDD
jgi:uncharacterized OB-fold protein